MKKNKAAGTVPLAFAYVLSLFIVSCNKQEAVIILPDQFSGQVSIIFDVDTAPALSFRNGLRVYNIPGSGILRTHSHYQPIASSGSLYYFRGPDGRIKPIALSGNIMKCSICPPDIQPNTITIEKVPLLLANKKVGEHKAETFRVQYNP